MGVFVTHTRRGCTTRSLRAFPDLLVPARGRRRVGQICATRRLGARTGFEIQLGPARPPIPSCSTSHARGWFAPTRRHPSGLRIGAEANPNEISGLFTGPRRPGADSPPAVADERDWTRGHLRGRARIAQDAG